MNLVSSIDKFGFYQIGNRKCYSKHEALEQSRQTKESIEYIFNDDVFSKFDWTIEPTSSLTEIYKQRAQQIRGKYDYVILCYSGGADSHNMLESFLNAGVRVDEIVSFHSFEGDGDKNSNFNKEIFETAIPFVESLKQCRRLPPSVSHRLLDLTDVINNFCKEINWLDFTYYINSSVSINNVARAWLRKYVLDWKNLIDSNKKLVLVWGHDKPRLMNHHNKFFLNFLDIQDNCVSPWIQQFNPPGWFDELFYSTPDMPNLVIKQAHVTANFLTSCAESHHWLTDEITGLGHVIKKRPDGSQKAKWLTQDGQSFLIYPWFNPKLYYEKKPLDIIYSYRDQWFWKNTEFGNQWNNAIGSMITTFGDEWLNVDLKRNTRSTKNFRSRKYWLN
jgi:hypothetical protein